MLQNFFVMVLVPLVVQSDVPGGVYGVAEQTPHRVRRTVSVGLKSSAVPSGLRLIGHSVPSVETLGYFQPVPTGRGLTAALLWKCRDAPNPLARKNFVMPQSWPGTKRRKS